MTREQVIALHRDLESCWKRNGWSDFSANHKQRADMLEQTDAKLTAIEMEGDRWLVMGEAQGLTA